MARDRQANIQDSSLLCLIDRQGRIQTLEKQMRLALASLSRARLLPAEESKAPAPSVAVHPVTVQPGKPIQLEITLR